MLGQSLNFYFGRLECDAFGQVSFDVLQERCQRRSGQLMEVHELVVGPNFVLDAVLLVHES